MTRALAVVMILAGFGTLGVASQQPPNQPIFVVNGVPIDNRQQPSQRNGPGEDDPLARVLFPPELVMQHQQDIALRAEQRTAITKAIQDFQTKVVDLQWRMQDQAQRLATLLDKPAVDQAAALAQVDEVLGVEREVKRAHMTLLIQIKNTLSADQQAKLAAARGAPPHP